MSKYMTRAEIEAQFDSEWVLLENPRKNALMEVEEGILLHHSKNRDEVYDKADQLQPQRFAVLYIGIIPEDAAIVL